MTRLLKTERAAWVRVAEHVAAGEGQGWLCGRVADLRVVHGLIDLDMQIRMHARIDANMRAAGGTRSTWAFDPNDRDVRVLAALNLAVQAAQEGK